jgi:CheY-like chemotaxis protein
VKILVIDDAMLSRRKLLNILKDKGYSLLEAKDGEEGLEMILEHQPDCLVTDLLMPNVSGVQLLGILQERGIKIPTIVVSADIQDTTKDQCLKLGAVAILNKPPKADEVISAINLAMGT